MSPALKGWRRLSAYCKKKILKLCKTGQFTVLEWPKQHMKCLWSDQISDSRILYNNGFKIYVSPFVARRLRCKLKLIHEKCFCFHDLNDLSKSQKKNKTDLENVNKFIITRVQSWIQNFSFWCRCRPNVVLYFVILNLGSEDLRNSIFSTFMYSCAGF